MVKLRTLVWINYRWVSSVDGPDYPWLWMKFVYITKGRGGYRYGK